MTTVVSATTVPTPVGPLALLVRDDALVAAGFTSVADQFGRLAFPARLELVDDLGRFSAAARRYFDGDVTAWDDLPVDQPGGPFRQAAWKAMREIPPGQVRSYAELAELAGNGRAVRAAGSACARNLVAPIVPCHRVVRSGGALGGYYYGIDVKQWLLAHERAHAPG
jgi:methylated-DNA-[protein]-cysteine S-methyltransferase